MEVLKLRKSGGVVARSAVNRKDARSLRAKDYFYGVGNGLQPESATAALTDFQASCLRFVSTVS